MRLIIPILLLFVLPAFAHPGVGIVKDQKGNVYYTDLTHVWKIDATGSKSIAVRNVHTHELFLDEQDNLFGEHLWYNGEAANTWGYYVWKLSSTGELQKIIPKTIGFRDNYSFVQDHLGRMYWTNGERGCQHLTRKNRDETETVLGTTCLSNVRWMTASSSGNIFLIDQGDLKKVDSHGQVSLIANDLPQSRWSQFFVNENHYLGGLALDKQQNIYVADFSGRNVKKIGLNGVVTIVAETSIPWSPTGLLVDDNGDLWMLEYSITNDARVELRRADGSRTIF